jgi:hypothetical protein
MRILCQKRRATDIFTFKMPWEGNTNKGEADEAEERKNPVGVAHFRSSDGLEDVVEGTPTESEREGIERMRQAGCFKGWALHPSTFLPYSQNMLPPRIRIHIWT